MMNAVVIRQRSDGYKWRIETDRQTDRLRGIEWGRRPANGLKAVNETGRGAGFFFLPLKGASFGLWTC